MKKSLVISFVMLLAVVSVCAKEKKAKTPKTEDDSVLQVTLSEKETKTKEVNVETLVPELDMKYYRSWNAVPNKKVDSTYGIIRLRAIPKRGAFNIGVVNQEGKTIGVLSNQNEYSTSYFTVKLGKKVYKLTASADIRTKARATENNVQVIYNVDDTADILLEFNPFETVTGAGIDLLQVKVTVTNLTNKALDVTLKNVMDTILGEADVYHFYTSDDLPVKTETTFRSMSNAKYFNSKNNAAWAQFLLDGADITPADSVSLANFSTVDTSSWEPATVSNRTFDTVTSYNNSAVEIIWPAKKILKDESTVFIYYLAFAADGNRPNGYEYISARTKGVPVASGDTAVKVNTVPEVKTPVSQPEPDPVEDVEEIDDDYNSIPKELLTPEYIQSLLDRIESLEADNPSLNRTELQMLNDELDFILSIMRG